MSSDKKPPNLSLMRRAVSKVILGEKLLTSHLTDLGLISTSLVPPCGVDLELLCCCNVFSNKGCEIVNAVAGMFPKGLLGLLLTPPALSIYPDTI